ncbi:hypothetical protein BDV93DRAFT_292739 [Ceratobasidium sp. AG-I]|nr:hypothetical protein BDV93DRAFT_292739 [Ceratobasidium sp. AG-I]
MSSNNLSSRLEDTGEEVPTNEVTGEAPNSVSASDDLFFDIPREETVDSGFETPLSAPSAIPLFLPSSSEATTKPLYRDSQSADIEWIPSEDEQSLPPTRPPSSTCTRSAPSSIITISDSEDEHITVPPPAKKRKQVSPGMNSNSTSVGASNQNSLFESAKKRDTESPNSESFFVGTVGVDAWFMVNGKGQLQKGEILRLERDASATGLPGKTTAKSSSKSVAALAAAAKKKIKEDAIVRIVNSGGSEVGRIVTDAARWIAKLLDKDLVHITGTPIDPPTEFKRTGDHFKILLQLCLKASAFRPISTPSKSAAEKYLSSTAKKTAIIFEGAETSEEQALRERKASLLALFGEVGLKPRRSGFGDYAKKKGAKGKGKRKEGGSVANTQEGEHKEKGTPAKQKGKNTETIGEGEEAEEAELEGEELNKGQLGDIYEKAQRDDKELPFMTPPDSFTLTLRPYQQQALHWMWNLERGERSARDTTSLHPLWEEYVFPFEDDGGVIDLCAEERPFYFNPYSGELSLEFVKTENHWRGGILACVMGMGKSIMTSSLIHASQNAQPSAETSNPALGPSKNQLAAAFGKRKRTKVEDAPAAEPHATLLVAPISLLAQWQSELDRCSKPGTLRTLIWHGLNRPNLFEALGPQSDGERAVDVVITSYGTLSSEYANTEKGKSSQVYDVQWMRVVLDEAHFCKSRHTKNAKACYKLSSVYRWALTGTPIVNRLEDLYSLLCFLKYAPWSSFAYFKSFITTPFLNRDPRAIQIIQVILENVLLRREKSMRDVDGNQIVELPPKIMNIEELTFTPAERKAYMEVYTFAKKEFGDMDNTGTVSKNFASMFAQIMRLRQAVLHPDLIKAQKERVENEEIDIESDDEDDISVSNRKPSTSLQTLKNGGCPVCFETAESPVAVQECGHSGCKKCFNNFLKMCREKEDALVCPVCRVALNQDQPWVEVDANNVKDEVDVAILDAVVPSSQKSTTNTEEFKSSTKVDALLRNLKELREKDPSLRAIVFSQFTSFLDIIQKALARDGFDSLRLDGSMSQQQRSHSLQSFASPDLKPKIFCISLRAGGVGLNLTQAQYVFMMDFWWNRAAENQAIDRIHRIGQTRTVYVKHFIKDTIEKRVLQIQKRKTAIVQGAFGKAGGKGTKESVQNMKLMFGD